MKKKLNKSLSLDEIFAFINVLKIISKNTGGFYKYSKRKIF